MISNNTQWVFMRNHTKKSILCNLFGHNWDVHNGKIIFNNITGDISYIAFCLRCEIITEKIHVTNPDDPATSDEHFVFKMEKEKK